MTVSVLFDSRGYRVRIFGAGTDTKRNVPRELFGDVPCDRKSKRGDRIARRYADELEESNGQGERHQGFEGKEAEDATGSVFSRVASAGRESHGSQLARTLNLAAIGALFLSRNRAILDPKTIRRYECTLAQLVAFFGDERPDRLHVGRLEEYRDHRLASHWTPRPGTVPRRQISPQTVHGELTFAAQLLGFGFDRAIETGMASLPVRKAPPVADHVRTRGRVLTVEEFWRAYEAAGSLQRAANRLQRLLALGLTTMLRSDALLRLVSDEGVRWVDLISRTVTVPPQFVKKGRGRVRKELMLPLCDWAVDAIGRGASKNVDHSSDQRGSRQDEATESYRFRDRSREPSNAVMAPWRSGSATEDLEVRGSIPLGVRPTWGAPVASVQSTLNRITQIAGIRHFSLHDVRATGASYLLNHKCDRHSGGIQKIATDRLLGHAIPPNDARYYQVEALATEAVWAFDELWNAYRGVDGVNVVAIGAGR